MAAKIIIMLKRRYLASAHPETTQCHSERSEESPMRISMIGPSYPFKGGISHYTTLLYKNIKKKHDTHFYAFKRQYPQWLFPGRTDIDKSSDPIREEGVENVLDSLNPLTWLKVFLEVKSDNPELVILPWWVSFWAPQFWIIATLIKKFTPARVLFICHNVVEHESNKIDQMCTRLVLKKGDHFVVHSGEDLRNLKRIKPDADVRQNFHPTYEVFNTLSIAKEDARRQLGLEGNTILFFGFVRPYKGLSYLIEAMPRIIRNVDVNLLIVGEIWKGEEGYWEQTRRLGLEKHVRFINRYVPNEEVGLYFAASDLVVLPYVSATGSGVVQAALGCERPVVTTRVGCLPEVIDDGRTGYLVPPEDSRAIADAVVSFYAEEKEEEFRQNILKQRETFSWDRMVSTIEGFDNGSE
jgi:glycosyltransferase involved in cell wall biosynthesis